MSVCAGALWTAVQHFFIVKSLHQQSRGSLCQVQHCARVQPSFKNGFLNTKRPFCSRSRQSVQPGSIVDEPSSNRKGPPSSTDLHISAEQNGHAGDTQSPRTSIDGRHSYTLGSDANGDTHNRSHEDLKASAQRPKEPNRPNIQEEIETNGSYQLTNGELNVCMEHNLDHGLLDGVEASKGSQSSAQPAREIANAHNQIPAGEEGETIESRFSAAS